MSHYAVEIDLDNPNVSHSQVVDLVGDAKRVLDVGCWAGDLGEVLRKRGAVVDGLELDETAAKIAADRLHRVVVANLEHERLGSHFEAGTYDAIIFADVLEHLTDPATALRDAIPLLADGGRIVISIPNVTHGAVRLALLQGRWRTTDTGLLDRTHVRFYDRAGLLELLGDAGLIVEQLRGTTADPLNVETEIDESDLPDGVVEWVRDQEDAFIYQFQLAARPARNGEHFGPTPPLVPAVAPAQIRPHDHHADARVRAGRDTLVMQDHIIGLQAAATTQRARADKLQARVRRMRERARRLENQVKQLRGRVESLEGQLAQPGWRRTASRVARRLRG